ncbi:MAG: DoxX family membrane protein [Acidobacteria bacterium]|nr:DoxX family membrane protein [Acidobacteriota bacterium]
MRFRTYIPVVVRTLLGALFIFSGANKVVPFMTLPPMPEAATSFLGALVATGYFMPLLGLTEVVAGALLVVGRFVPLALVLLAPIVVQIALFHVVLAPDLASVVMIVGAQIYLAWVYRDAFAGVLTSTRA